METVTMRFALASFASLTILCATAAAADKPSANNPKANKISEKMEQSLVQNRVAQKMKSDPVATTASKVEAAVTAAPKLSKTAPPDKSTVKVNKISETSKLMLKNPAPRKMLAGAGPKSADKIQSLETQTK
jgi:hypothetical protein